MCVIVIGKVKIIIKFVFNLFEWYIGFIIMFFVKKKLWFVFVLFCELIKLFDLFYLMCW